MAANYFRNGGLVYDTGDNNHSPLPGGQFFAGASGRNLGWLPDELLPGWGASNQLAARRKNAIQSGLPNTPGYKTLRLTKNPALETLNVGNLGRVSNAAGQNDTDLADYLAQARSNNAANLGDLGQELGSIGDAYNGALSGQLADVRGRYRDSVLGTNARAGADLGAMREGYKSTGNQLIDDLAAKLGSARSGYESRVGGEITAEEAARLGLRKGYATAARRGTDLAIAGAARSNKAANVAAGGMGGSYFQRLALGQRNAAESDLAQRLSDRELSDYTATRGQRAALTGELGALERGEIGATGEQRMRLADTLNNQERTDYGHTLGVEERLNDSLGAAERGDLGYVRSEQARGLGQRRTLRNAGTADLLAPISARQSVNEGNLRLGSMLGSLDQSNNFYGIDDGGASYPGMPYVPQFSRGGGYQPDFGRGAGGGEPYQFRSEYYGPQPARRSATRRGYSPYPVYQGLTTGMSSNDPGSVNVPGNFDYGNPDLLGSPYPELYQEGYDPRQARRLQEYYDTP